MAASTQPLQTKVAAAVADAAVAGVKAAMAYENACMLPEPSMHMICDQHPRPYRGYVKCRPFYAGVDAHNALVGLTQMAAILNADRLVFCWEHEDLLIALTQAKPNGPNALVTAEVTLTAHMMTWRAFDIKLGAVNPRTNLPTGFPTWGKISVLNDAVLPPAIGTAVLAWRVGRHDGGNRAEWARREMEKQGYSVTLMQ